MLAAAGGHLSVVQWLVNEAKANVEAKNKVIASCCMSFYAYFGSLLCSNMCYCTNCGLFVCVSWGSTVVC